MKTIEIKELVKRYKELLALDHFNLEVREGEILGFLGPNGCGKTTAILPPDFNISKFRSINNISLPTLL